MWNSQDREGKFGDDDPKRETGKLGLTAGAVGQTDTASSTTVDEALKSGADVDEV